MDENIFRAYDKAEFQRNPTVVFDDWDAFCQSPNGVFAKTSYVDELPPLPAELEQLTLALREFVPDEGSLENPSAPFNGNAYYLRRVTREIRRFGEKIGCKLEFGPSDYRRFLVTNGMDAKWSRKLGIKETFSDPVQWAQHWEREAGEVGFFENSFGVNAIVTALAEDRTRCCVFFQRSHHVAVGQKGTVGSMDEGVRRGYGDQLFDQSSRTDLTPDLERALYRGLREELGITETEIGCARPILMSVGRVRSLRQPAALYYLPLEISAARLRLCIETAPDRRLESSIVHFIPFTLESIRDFIAEQYDSAPVASWVAVMALYALRSDVVETPRVFMSYSHADRRMVRSLVNELEQRGVFVWLDEGEMRPGDLLTNKLADAINDVDVVVAVISKNSVKSKWVNWELNNAITNGIDGKRLRVLPIRRDPCKIPTNLTGIYHADFSTPKRKRQNLPGLLKAICDSG